MNGLTINKCLSVLRATSSNAGPSVPWGLGLLGLCAVLWLLHMWAFEHGLRLIHSALPNRGTDFLVEAKAFGALTAIAVLFEIRIFCKVRYKCNVERVLGLVPFRGLKYLFPGVLCAVSITLIEAVVYLALVDGDAYVFRPFGKEARVAHMVAYYLQTALVEPYFEEVVFRGLIYTWLRRRCTCAASLLLSSCLWALVHGWADVTFIIFISGVFLGLCYERTKALSLPIIAHSTMNISTSLIAALLTQYAH